MRRDTKYPMPKRPSTEDFARAGETLPAKTLRAVERDIHKVLLKHFTKTYDGSLPVEVTIVDRTRCERLHFEPVVYAHKASDTDIMENLSVVQLNISLASDQLRHAQYEVFRRFGPKEKT
jgi:hypothetical protein